MQIEDWIRENSEPKYADFSRKIIKTRYPINGIRVSVLRLKAKSLTKESGLKALEQLGTSTYEEMMMRGFIIAFSKADLSAKEPLILGYLKGCDNWSMVDSFVSCFKTDKPSASYWHMLNRWQADTVLCCQHAYVQRFIIVFMMSYYLDDEHIEAILDICASLNEPEQTVKMAVGWLLTTASINYYERVRRVLTMLDRKILQIYKGKIRDSYRISAQIKAEVYVL